MYGMGETAMRLENKVAIVTGAATGIGRAIAVAMASEGAAVAIDYVGPPDHAAEVVRQIEQNGGRALAVDAGVADMEQVKHLVEQTVQTFCRLDIMGKPEEVAEMAVYLASDAAAYITGSTYFIDGGMLRHAGSL
jgi:NAD(P)-dependent dehydrogenase (short-subunit alcohol dehydrogenase family)